MKICWFCLHCCLIASKGNYSDVLGCFSTHFSSNFSWRNMKSMVFWPPYTVHKSAWSKVSTYAHSRTKSPWKIVVTWPQESDVHSSKLKWTLVNRLRVNFHRSWISHLLGCRVVWASWKGLFRSWCGLSKDGRGLLLSPSEILSSFLDFFEVSRKEGSWFH